MSLKNIEDVYPLSPMQQGMLFHSIYAPNSGVYVEQMCFELHGTLNVTAFAQAWQQVITRHPALRIACVWENLEKPLQVVCKEVKFPWEQLDWRSIPPIEQQQRLKALLQSERQNGFLLSQAPLMRFILIRLAEQVYHFCWSHHHLLLDGWSGPIVYEEVIAYYRAFCKGENLYLAAPPAYRDYIAWLQQQNVSQAEVFWRKTLSGFTSPNQLGINPAIGYQLHQEQDYKEQKLKLSSTKTAVLNSFVKQHQLTLNTLIQGLWALLLSRYSGEQDIVFGATVSGRPPTLANSESMVGLFINTLPVRVQVNPKQELLPWLQQLLAQQIEARQYEYAPLVDMQKWSEVPASVPLFESIVVFENYPLDETLTQPDLNNVKIKNIQEFEKTNYPLTLSIIPGRELLFKIAYQENNRFDVFSIKQMLEHLQTLLEGMIANPYQRLEQLPLLTSAEQQLLLVEWNNTQIKYPNEKCIHELFESQVEETPDAIAVVFEEEQLTYRELNARANQLAHYLQKLGVKPEVLVGICVERSLSMVIGLLAILKAGGAYIPLDPSYPQKRIAFILEDTQAPVLLTQASLLESTPQHQAAVVCLDTDWHLIAQQSQENVFPELTTDNLAYTIYTSGSTGKPKGVQIPHIALSNFLYSMKEVPGLTSEDTLLAVTTYSFDIAALELFLPIIVGARLVIAGWEIVADGTLLSAKLVDSKATVMQATPATWQLLLAAGWDGNHQLKILCGGEVLPGNLANQLLGLCDSLWNMYGPTETTIWSAASQVKTVDNTVPISSPIANTQLYILDKYHQLVPVGVTGELCIGGEGLARGYFQRPDLTAEKFIPNPFSDKPARLYRTGDLARYLPSGDIEYIGRIDNQVKVRGFRIELGEIEAIISQHPGVREAVVTVHSSQADSQRIVAYVVPQKEQAPTISQLRGFVEAKLPSYMVPSAFVTLEALPLTPNGKVDRKALPLPDSIRPQLEAVYQPPQTEIEQTIADIWQKLLKLEDVGIHDNFFELGGHSLLVVQVHSNLREVLKRDLSLLDLFRYPTINSLANYFNQVKNQEPSHDMMADITEKIVDGKAQQRKRLQKIKAIENI
jgi:amino acid adenylation domain-containing protein